jgi:hypothetical protein
MASIPYTIRKLQTVLTGSYNETLGSLETVEQAPVDQQVLDEKLLDAVTATGASTDVNVLDKSRLTIVAYASSVTTGGTLKIQGSPDGTNYADLATFADGNTTGATSQDITADGTYVFTLPSTLAIKYIRANLSARTDGTYTVYLYGGAI